MNHKIAPYLFVILAIVLRLIPHVPNAAPIGALALLLGATLPKKTAVIITILSMLFTDIFIGFHDVIMWVYGSYALIAVLSKKHLSKKIGSQISYSLLASLVFYFLTNFGVWAATSMYEKSLSGLLASYLNALPFLRSTVLGDMLYTLVFFALYGLVAKNSVKLPAHSVRQSYANSL